MRFFMIYHSTRNASLVSDSCRAVLEGLAPDGGLYVPQQLPQFDWKKCLDGSSIQMSIDILSALLPDIPIIEAEGRLVNWNLINF